MQQHLMDLNNSGNSSTPMNASNDYSSSEVNFNITGSILVLLNMLNLLKVQLVSNILAYMYIFVWHCSNCVLPICQLVY